MRVAILSRGYGRRRRTQRRSLGAAKKICPTCRICKGPDRVALATAAVEELGSELLVLDDGFQHRRLGAIAGPTADRRDRSVGTWGSVAARLAARTAGSLRRARRRRPDALRSGGPKSAGTAAQSGAAACSRPARRRGDASAGRTGQQRANRGRWNVRERPLAAFCGIGNPDAFRRTLLDLGGESGASPFIPDHHAYTRADVDELQLLGTRPCRRGGAGDDAKGPGQAASASAGRPRSCGPAHPAGMSRAGEECSTDVCSAVLRLTTVK